MNSLETRRLGRTELRPRALGLGGAWWGAGTEAECIAGIRRALELGIDFFDTYPGEFEERWGKALKGCRSQIYLQGKVSYLTKRPSDHSGAASRASVEASLKALQTDYLDVVLIHGYDQLEHVETRADMVDPLGPGNALDELVKMKQAGMVRHIGIGAWAADVHRRAIETGEIEVVLTYMEYNLLTQSMADTMFPLAKEHDVGVILASPLAMGLLTGDAEHARNAAATPQKADDPDAAWRAAMGEKALVMTEWCQARDLDIRQLALQFCLAAPVDGIVLPGPANLEQVESTYEAATAGIAPGVWEEFREVFGVGV